MTVVILQPSYIPWRGFFHLIQKADTFVFFDDVQYDKRGWRNRNRIKTQNGPVWLTIPANAKGSQTDNILIKDVPVVYDEDWAKKHWRSLQLNYGKAPFFKQYAPLVESFYQQRPVMLADFTISTSITLSETLGLRNKTFLRSSELEGVEGQKTDRLLSVLKKVGATHYISGPSAKDYIENDKFEAAGITLEYIDYRYEEYPQLHPPYDPQVSVLDLLFMTGPEAGKHIWGDAEI
jgi:hypothetical protein